MTIYVQDDYSKINWTKFNKYSNHIDHLLRIPRLMFYLFHVPDRLPRRPTDAPGTRDHPVILIDSDLSRLPLPDLVLSAVEQLPPPEPQVTVSAPSSPTRDAAFQFPECSVPVPSPRPRPRRRRLTSESSVLEKDNSRSDNNGICTGCCGHIRDSLNEREWATVGANLRNIADDFHASKTKVREPEKPSKSSIECHHYFKIKSISSDFTNDFNECIEIMILLISIVIIDDFINLNHDFKSFH